MSAARLLRQIKQNRAENYVAKSPIISPENATWGPFYLAWLSNYIHYKVSDEIRYPFPNFNSCWNFNRCCNSGVDKWFYPTLYWAYDYLSMLGIMLPMLVKGVPGDRCNTLWNTYRMTWRAWVHFYISIVIVFQAAKLWYCHWGLSWGPNATRTHKCAYYNISSCYDIRLWNCS